jgi:hypothetical protein
MEDLRLKFLFRRAQPQHLQNPVRDNAGEAAHQHSDPHQGREVGAQQQRGADNEKGSQEYEAAGALLRNHEKLVQELYEMATTAIYSDGCCCFNQETVRKELRDINFCGREWLMERCEKRITKEGY